MKPLIDTQSRLASILDEYQHLSPDMPLRVFEARCRRIHILILRYINAHAPKDPI